MSSSNNGFLGLISRLAHIGGSNNAIKALGMTIAFFLLLIYIGWWILTLVFRIIAYFRRRSAEKKAQQEQMAAEQPAVQPAAQPAETEVVTEETAATAETDAEEAAPAVD